MSKVTPVNDTKLMLKLKSAIPLLIAFGAIIS